MMVLTALPVALVAGASPTLPTALRPTDLAPSIESLTAPISAGEIAKAGAFETPEAALDPVLGGDAAPYDSTQDSAREKGDLAAKAAVRSYLKGVVTDPADVDLPLLEFLEKYPALKERAATISGIPALAAQQYTFSPEERNFIYATLRLSSIHSNVDGVLVPWSAMAPEGTRQVLAVAPTLLIDDDGSENNFGWGANTPDWWAGWPLTNQTALVASSLTNRSIPFDLYVRPFGGAMPTFSILAGYDQIIVVSGQSFLGFGAQATRRLSGFLEAEGDVWMIGEFTPYRAYATLRVANATVGYPEFLSTYLGISSFYSAGTANPMDGTASSFLAGASYPMSRSIPNNFTGFQLDYSFQLNYSATAEALTIGTAVDLLNVTQNNVVNNIRNHPAGKGIALTSAFEYNYFASATDRDNFTELMFNNLSSSPGLAFDTSSDVSPVEIDFVPELTGWAQPLPMGTINSSWFIFNGADGSVFQFYLVFGSFIERGRPATMVVTVDNYRDAAFTTDIKIELTGEGVYNPITRVENASRIAAQLIGARATITVTMDFTPHRAWTQDAHVILGTGTPDTVTTNNEFFLFSVGVAGYFDGAETQRATTNASGFQRVTNNPAGAHAGTAYWFTGAGPNLNNALTFPWIDLRYFNDSGPGQGEPWYIDDFLYFYFWYRGDVTPPDGLLVEYRNNTVMTWTEAYNVNGSTGSPSDWAPFDFGWYLGNFQNGDPAFLLTTGVPIPWFLGDQFVQVRLRYLTGNNNVSTGYQIDDVGWYVMNEFNAPVDFHPLFSNQIVSPSPSYTVKRGNTVIASGQATGTIDVNETENVTISTGMVDPHGDFFTYAWTQSVPGFASMPADVTTPVYSASPNWTFLTDLNTYEGLLAAGGGSNVITFTLTATEELRLVNSTSWTVRLRDAPPQVGTLPPVIAVDEDGFAYFPYGPGVEWFTDPQSDFLTYFATSPLVNGTPTLALLDPTTTGNGTIGLHATAPDWFGLTNITITVRDTKNSAITVKLNVTVRPVNDPPRVNLLEIAALNLLQGTQGIYIAFNLTLFDVDNAQSTLTYTWNANPAGKWQNGTNVTGNVLFSPIGQYPDNAMVGPNFFNVSICDPQGLCSLASFRIYINNVNDRPTITTTNEVRYLDQGVPFRLQVVAIDPDDLIPDATQQTQLLWSDDTTLFEIDPVTGVIDFTPSNNDVSSTGWTVIIRVSDQYQPTPGTHSRTFTFIVNNTNDPPILPAYPDITVTQDQQLTPQLIKATDADLALWQKGVFESITYTDDTPLFVIEQVPNTNPVTGQPEPSGRITIRATNDQVGTWFVNITATDALGLSSRITIKVIVNNAADPPANVRLYINDSEGGTKLVTAPNTKVIYDEDVTLTIEVSADDPDLHFRQSDPNTRVDPAEKLVCSVTSQFLGGLSVDQTGTEKPTVDPDTCLTEFTGGDNEVGTFTVTYTVRDAASASTSFRFTLEIQNVNDAPASVRVVSPAEGFTWPDSTTQTLTGSATDVDSADSQLTYSWTVEVVGGQRVTQPGKSAQVSIANAETVDKQVKVTLKVTDNADAANPIEISTTINGTIKGKPAAGFIPGLEVPLIIGGVALAAAIVALRRRRFEE